MLTYEFDEISIKINKLIFLKPRKVFSKNWHTDSKIRMEMPRAQNSQNNFRKYPTGYQTPDSKSLQSGYHPDNMELVQRKTNRSMKQNRGYRFR